jgi:RHS repeat-associated protein
VYGYTGEMQSDGLVHLRARDYASQLGRFTSRDTWEGNYEETQLYNKWGYVNNNPINTLDPSGNSPLFANDQNEECPIGGWDCEAVSNVNKLKSTLLESAPRHNKVPRMDNNAFAGLIASILVSETRIGNKPKPNSQLLEDIAAFLGCTVSGHAFGKAIEDKDYGKLPQYFLNLDIPQRATVGIGNIWLKTGAEIWHNKACFNGSIDKCIYVPVSPMKKKNLFGQEVEIPNPFDPYKVCVHGICDLTTPTNLESYIKMEHQLLNENINIEYLATNLEMGALRAMTNKIQPTAFNSASWHLKGLQTDDEIEGIWDPGAAVNILDHIPVALYVMDLSSTWNLSMEPQYAKYKY